MTTRDTTRYTTVQRYLESKLGDDLKAAREAMETLAGSFGRDALAKKAYELYKEFRPDVPKGKKGWGAEGALDLGEIRGLADSS